MKYKIKHFKTFVNVVIDAQSIIQYWPEILTEGVELKKFRDGFNYIMVDGKVAHETAFFLDRELQYLELVN